LKLTIAFFSAAITCLLVGAAVDLGFMPIKYAALWAVFFLVAGMLSGFHYAYGAPEGAPEEPDTKFVNAQVEYLAKLVNAKPVDDLDRKSRFITVETPSGTYDLLDVIASVERSLSESAAGR